MTSNQSLAGAKCVACHGVIDASWSFCPICGADNRDPVLHRGPAGDHTHDFRYGAHCVLCGAGGGHPAVPQNQLSPIGFGIGNVVLSEDQTMRLFGVAFIAGSLLAIGVVVYISAQARNGTDARSLALMILFFSAFGVIGVLALFREQTTIFDPQARIVTLRRGFTFAPKFETFSFDQVEWLRLDFSSGGTAGSNPCSLCLARQNSRWTTNLKNYAHLDQGRAAGEDLSRQTGIPFKDFTSWLTSSS